MSIHPLALAQRLNEMIATDSRASDKRNRFSRRSGFKRTQLEQVRAIRAADFAGAIPITQRTQTSPINMGNTTWGTFTSGPLTAEAINQGMLADCYLLIAMLLIARLRPFFFDDIFVKLDDKTVIVQWYYGGYILQIRTSLLISTDYNHPSNGDVRPELAEKTWCLVRSGLSDYLQNNYGLIYCVFTALGLDGSLGALNSAAIIAAMQAGKAVGLQTTPGVTGKNAVEDWIQSHAYGAVDFDPASKNLTLAQPWHAAQPIPGVDPATIAGGKVFNLVHLGVFPPTPRILASMVSGSDISVPATPIAADSPDPRAISVPPNGVNLPPDKCFALANCRLETQATGKVDIGYISGAAWVEFLLNVGAPDAYTLTIEAAAVTPAELEVRVNGTLQAAAVAVPNTGAWNRFAPLTVALVFPAGPVTLRLANRYSTQYNLGAIDIRPATAPQDDPIVSISVLTTRKSGKALTTAVL